MQGLSDLIEKAASEIDAADDLAALDAVRVTYLGKKGEITARLKTLGSCPCSVVGIWKWFGAVAALGLGYTMLIVIWVSNI